MYEDNSQSNKLQLLGKLNASFVHEIRNPLFALKLNLDYLNMTENLSKDVKDSVETCIEAVDRIQYLIENILNFSRKPKAPFHHCSLDDITNEAIELVAGYAGKIKCEIVKEIDPNIKKVYFNKNKLLQVFLNLIINAIEASKEGEAIVIRIYEKNDNTFWEIEDFGTGIREEDKENIFNDFFTQKKEGTGLGLSICKEILAEINASMDFKSEFGKGTRFFIEFNHQAEKYELKNSTH
jgi:signal transduction histidine kinase